jgi:hypothetical protein
LDNVPGNYYDVKASGFSPSWHPQNFGIVPGFAPKAKQHEICLAKCEVVGSRATIVENVFIQERMQLAERNIEISSSFGFGIELLGWFERSSHNISFPYPCLDGCGGARLLYRGWGRLDIR